MINVKIYNSNKVTERYIIKLQIYMYSVMWKIIDIYLTDFIKC